MLNNRVYTMDYDGNPEHYWIVRSAGGEAAVLVSKDNGYVNILTSSDQAYSTEQAELWWHVMRRAWALASAQRVVNAIKK